MDLQKMINESDGPEDVKELKGQRLFDTAEEPTLGGMVDKLIHAANVIVDHRIAIAVGLETNKNAIFYNNNECEWVLKQVEPMLKTVEQTKKIQAESMKDVTKLLSKGKISIAEAKEYLNIIQQQTAMDLLEEIG